jgi:hypothetical protein
MDMASSMLKPITGIIDGLIPREMQGDALEAIASLDQPTLDFPPLHVANKAFRNWNVGNGPDNSVVLRADIKTMTMTDTQHYKKGDTMKIHDICRIPTSIPRFVTGQDRLWTWSTSQVVGDQLTDMYVGPMMDMLYQDNYLQAVAPGTGIIPTALTYATVPFQNWRGGLVYELEFYLSQGFHTGAVRVSFHPGVYDNTSLTTPQLLSSQYFAVFNIGEANKFTFRVPYIAAYPWLIVANQSDYTTAAKCRRYSTGIIVVSVVKRLFAMSQASPQISFSLRVSGDEDYEVANITSHNSSVQIAASPWEAVPFRTQSGEDAAEGDSQLTAHTETATTLTTDAIQEVTSNVVPDIPSSTSIGRFKHATPESPWSLVEAQNKMIEFANIDWGTSQLPGTLLAAFDLPSAILDAASLTGIGKDRFFQWHADSVDINITVAGSQFQDGALAVCWAPAVALGNFPPVGTILTGFFSSRTQIDMSQHMKLQPHTSDNNRMKISFIHPQVTLNVADGDSLGTLIVVVYSQLSNIPDTFPVNLSFHGSIADAAVFVPRPSGLTSSKGWTAFRTESGGEKKIILANPTISGMGQRPAVSLAKDASESTPSMPFKGKYHIGRQNLPHFEDTSNDIRALCKRVTPAWLGIVNVVANEPALLTLDLANEILFPDGTGVARNNNGTGFIGYFAPLYRFNRGDWRLKIVVQRREVTQVQPIQGWITISYPEGTVQPGTGYLVNTPMLTLNTAAFKYTPRGPNGHYFTLSDAQPYVLEVEVPRDSISQISINPAYSGAINVEPYTLGDINMVFRSTENESLDIRVYASFADATTFGELWTLPRLVINTGNYPDGYQPGTLRRVASETEDYSDIEVVEVPVRRSVQNVPRRAGEGSSNPNLYKIRK